MAAGTEVTQPVSVLEGAYKGLPLEARCRGMGKGIAGDDNNCQSETDNMQKDVAGKPPRPLTSVANHSFHPNGASGFTDCDKVESSQQEPHSPPLENSALVEFEPAIRSGVWFDIGSRHTMEDEHVRIDDLLEYLGSGIVGRCQGSYYGVFDGHDGINAAQFVKDRLLQFIVEDAAFPTAVEKAVHRAFLQTDAAFAEACSLDHTLSSGTTAITALVLGRRILVANAGDCRAVLCRRGKAVPMSRDHKPSCMVERNRIEALGGYVDDGYLNGRLGTSRALGDWHIIGLKGVDCPLSAEPELMEVVLTEEDEFMIIGCDGLWDVFTNENAVDFARRKLQLHNDPEQCSRDLVDEALRRHTGDNLTVVTVCFQVNPPPRLYSRFSVRRSISAEGLRNLQDLLGDLP